MSQGEFANVLVAYNVGFKLPGMGDSPTCELILVITGAAETSSFILRHQYHSDGENNIWWQHISPYDGNVLWDYCALMDVCFEL